MTKRINIPGGGYVLVGFPYQRKLSPRRLPQLKYLREHPELWDADLKVIVREMQAAGLISQATWWCSCTAVLWVVELARAEVDAVLQDVAVSEFLETSTLQTDASGLPS